MSRTRVFRLYLKKLQRGELGTSTFTVNKKSKVADSNSFLLALSIGKVTQYICNLLNERITQGRREVYRILLSIVEVQDVNI